MSRLKLRGLRKMLVMMHGAGCAAVTVFARLFASRKGLIIRITVSAYKTLGINELLIENSISAAKEDVAVIID